jgi:hypothetical protein
MADQEKIMDKIRALLEKTVENGASQEEAIAAAAAAQRLMAKYKISEITAQAPEEIDSTEMDINKQWQIELAHVLAKNLCCKCIRTHAGNRKIRFVIMGKKQDREVWQKMFETFFILIYRGAKEAKSAAKDKYGHCRDIELAYARGFIRAINEELGTQCRALALVVPEEVNLATHRRFPHLGRVNLRRISGTSATSEASSNGYSDGKIAAGQKRLSA